MSKHAVQQLLNKSFPAPAKEDWLKMASAELDGADPFETLAWLTQDAIKFLSYYDKNDAAQFSYQAKFDLHARSDSFSGAAAWFTMPKVAVADELSANQTALHNLATGADGIFFDVSRKSNVDVVKLLKDIEWQYCALSFYAQPSFLTALQQYLKTGINPMSGIIFYDKFPEPGHFPEHEKIKSLGVMVEPSTTVKEISQALTTAVKLIDAFSEKHAAESVIRNIAFSVPIGTVFLEDICKLKVLRMLWFQITQAYGVKVYLPEDLYIHARSEPWVQEQYQPHGNMLKNTASAMASVIGGCHSLTLYPEIENN